MDASDGAHAEVTNTRPGHEVDHGDGRRERGTAHGHEHHHHHEQEHHHEHGFGHVGADVFVIVDMTVDVDVTVDVTVDVLGDVPEVVGGSGPPVPRPALRPPAGG